MTATTTINGRPYQPFPKPVPMTVNDRIRCGSFLSPGQTVWAFGKDGSVYAIATTKKGVPSYFVATQFLTACRPLTA